MRQSTHILALLGTLSNSVLAYQWPDPQYEALERLLYEGTDVYGGTPSILTNACGRRVANGSPVAAEWLRLAYHDAATHNITDGTGGLDASIYYELDREENLGAGMKSSMNDFAASSSKFVSREGSDLIAMGTVWGVASCGGPIIPFRGGRVDAAGPGRLGVPQPQEPLDVHTERFRLQGFNATEMITLVACGHTLGGVRSLDFPDIVAGTGTAGELVVGRFDGTDAYDDSIISEYLNGTTTDPLVIVGNTTLQSDMRIFSSDGNATMKSLNSADEFNAACSALLERFINLVPSNVSLTEEITLLPFKIHAARLTVQNGTLVFVVDVRVAVTAAIQSAGKTPTAIAIFWCDARGANTGCPNNNAHTSVQTHPASFNDVLRSPVATAIKTSFVEYEFVLPIDPAQGLARFWFEVRSAGAAPVLEDNDGAGYVLDDSVIFVEELGSAAAAPGGGTQFGVVVGIRASGPPTSASVSVSDNTFIGTPSAPFATSVPLLRSTNTTLSSVAGYTMYTANFATPPTTAGHPTLDVDVVLPGAGGTTGLQFVKPRGVKDFFAPAAVDGVSTTSVQVVPTVVTAISTSRPAHTASGTGSPGPKTTTPGGSTSGTWGLTVKSGISGLCVLISVGVGMGLLTGSLL